jgi:predicted short-subunit dehydrogenase-like oxidoreductase (DUF2520 family)
MTTADIMLRLPSEDTSRKPDEGMREETTEATDTFAVIGQGRMGKSLSAAMRLAGVAVVGPLGRNADVGDATVVILCVPDSQIALAAAAVPRDRVVAHCSGVATLATLAPHDAFSMHPLLTVTNRPAEFTGVGCAVDANGARAQAVCDTLVRALRMRAFHVGDAMRPLYHAAASVASNYVITVLELAATLIERAGVPRHNLIPLINAATENWALVGAPALTGPIQRRDEATVARQRDAVAEHAPESLQLWDVLTAATRSMAQRTTTGAGT